MPEPADVQVATRKAQTAPAATSLGPQTLATPHPPAMAQRSPGWATTAGAPTVATGGPTAGATPAHQACLVLLRLHLPWAPASTDGSLPGLTTAAFQALLTAQRGEDARASRCAGGYAQSTDGAGSYQPGSTDPGYATPPSYGSAQPRLGYYGRGAYGGYRGPYGRGNSSAPGVPRAAASAPALGAASTDGSLPGLTTLAFQALLTAQRGEDARASRCAGGYAQSTDGAGSYQPGFTDPGYATPPSYGSAQPRSGYYGRGAYGGYRGPYGRGNSSAPGVPRAAASAPALGACKHRW